MKHFLFICFLISLSGNAQVISRFADEVDAIQKKYDTLWDASKETIVFTGSSSIRIWKDLGERFPGHQIVNSGFGGSQASDLLTYTYELILRFNPKKVFIYEGDNDIVAGRTPDEIIVAIKNIVGGIERHDPQTQIVLISAKPSLARWKLKRKYKRLNRKFNKLAQKDERINFIDVWKPMLNKRKVKQDIFLEDGLHMNGKGYTIWYSVIKNYIN